MPSPPGAPVLVEKQGFLVRIQTQKAILSIPDVPGDVTGIFHGLLTATLRGKYYYHFYLIDENTEAQRVK